MVVEKWFEELKANETNIKTYRCTEKVCEWIRKNLEIEIYGNSNEGNIIQLIFQKF